MSVFPITRPNSIAEIEKRVNAHVVRRTSPLLMLVLRTLLFVVFQAMIALLYWVRGFPSGWERAAAWWMLTATLTNVVCLLLLTRFLRVEGMDYFDLLKIERKHIGRDVLTTLAVTVVGAALTMVANWSAATLLFGDAARPVDLLFRPLPLWAVVPLLVFFPVTIALVELPTYFGYVLPRLATLSHNAWLALALVTFWVSVQHSALPLLFDMRFMVWRFIMFLPLMLVIGLLLYGRPCLLPYFMVMHGLADLQAAWMFLSLAQYVLWSNKRCS